MNIQTSRRDSFPLITAEVEDRQDLGPIRLSLGDTTVHLSVEEAGEVVDAIISALVVAQAATDAART